MDYRQFTAWLVISTVSSLCGIAFYTYGPAVCFVVAALIAFILGLAWKYIIQ